MIKNSQIIEQEIIAADISIETSDMNNDIFIIDEKLNEINKELDKYTSFADNTDYGLAVLSGILSGAIDATFIGETRVTEKGIGLSHKNVNSFIQQYAKARGFERERLKDSIGDLEKAFKVAQDNVWKGADVGVSAKNHHLADLAHHPTPLGLASAIIVQFLRVGTFVNKEGEWHFIRVETKATDLIEIYTPAVITGVLNWLVSLAEKKYEQESGEEVPRTLSRLIHLVSSTPILIEIAKCADNWFGHLVSDMGGSKNTAGGGMGIPGIFVSLLHEMAALPVLKDTGLPAFVNDIYVKDKWDLRHEFALMKASQKQIIPVAFNEILVRTFYFVRRFAIEFNEHNHIKEIEWDKVVPFKNRTVDRMLTVASITFTAADTADAAVHAALESGGNWILFAGKFVTRFNYIGAGRAVIAVVKEVSSEKKEAQLIHEKRILTEAKTTFTIQKMEEYKAKLEETISYYIAEDIESFIAGFEYMNQGLETGDSNLVIKGNVVIQRVLGREPQFTNQDEFDDLMGSEIPLIF